MKRKTNLGTEFGHFHTYLTNIFTPALVVYAHCDTLDGPVVTAAKNALQTKNPNLILIWVKQADEKAIKKIFEQVMAEREDESTPDAKAKVDTELFEALVRIHREGEGAKYEGLQPAGSVEPDIALADKAVETGNLDEILKRISSKGNQEIIRHLYHNVRDKSKYDVNDVSSGREFVESYVIFIHAVENAIKGVALEESKLHNH